jgi:glycine betaine/proline transport system substrate-binding protein
MTGKAINEQGATARRAMSRRDMLKLSGGTLAGAYILGLTGCEAAGTSGSKSLTIGNIGWDENVAVSNLTKILLENDLGYGSVDLKLLDVGLLFDGVARGDLDAFQDVWLPKTHATYWKKYKDQVVDLGQWYEGAANLGLGVPDYVEAQSIGDLSKYRNEFGGEIIGIEPGSGIMKITQNDVIPGYNLDYNLAASSTPAMLAEVKRAIGDKKPIVFTAWKPHWMFTAYPIRYLEDPKNLMGGNEHPTAIAREGLKDEMPDAQAFLDALTLNESQLGKLELMINDAKGPVEGVRAWLKNNRDVVQPWVDAAKKARKT